MSGSNKIDVRVDNLLVRFTPTPAVDLEEAVERLGGVVNGDVIIKMLDAPRATLIIDAEGRIIVHGTHRIEAARAAAPAITPAASTAAAPAAANPPAAVPE